MEGSHVTTLSQLAYDPTMEVRRETLHGHTAALPMELLVGADHIDLVMIAAGGCIYDDDQWALAVLRAARQLAPADVDETEFWSVYDAQRQAQGGSLSRAVATHFLPSGDSRGAEQAREKPLPGAGRVDVSGAGRPARTPSADVEAGAGGDRCAGRSSGARSVMPTSCASRSVSTRAAPSAINGSSPTCSATPD